METFKKRTGKVEAVRFPDNGPEQYAVSEWVERNGAKMYFYDGLVEQHISTSTDANWRWRRGSLEGVYESVSIGDWIVKDIDGVFRRFTPKEFEKLFIVN